MTDNEIIKALEHCEASGIGACEGCPAFPCGGNCARRLITNALNLIYSRNNANLPCKVGDEVWAIRQYRHIKIPVKGKVSEMYYIDESMTLCIVVKGVCRGEWGKTVFPSLEEAANYLNLKGVSA